MENKQTNNPTTMEIYTHTHTIANIMVNIMDLLCNYHQASTTIHILLLLYNIFLITKNRIFSLLWKAEMAKKNAK